MGDSSEPKSKGIPSWQLSTVSDTSRSSGKLSMPTSRASLIEKASKFLDDEDIRDASKERKTYFLQTKGLTDEEISDLLRRKQQVTQAEEVKRAEKEDEETTQMDGSAAPSQSPTIDITDDYIDSEPPPPPKQDGLPIITYPEFLLHSQKPPPLITAARLLTALYVASGAAAIMYGCSNYMVEPMVESLSSARHLLFETASSNLDKLNEKMQNNVSKIPNGIQGHNEVDGAAEYDDSSDPARFFSRTIATQTSPRLSRSTSSTSLSEKTANSAVAIHGTHMSRIHELLSDLKEEEDQVSDPVKDNVHALTEYLFSLPVWGSTRRTRTDETIKNDDGVTKLKTDIKSVKGMLLSARNFPAGVTRR